MQDILRSVTVARNLSTILHINGHAITSIQQFTKRPQPIGIPGIGTGMGPKTGIRKLLQSNKQRIPPHFTDMVRHEKWE